MTKLKKTAKPDKLNHDQLEHQLKRALADYQNLERRVSEERALLSQLTSALLIEKFLPVLDNLQSAQAHLNDEGLALVVKQFQDVLKSEGVEEIEAEGSKFDPRLHEAVEVVESAAGPDEGGNEGRIVKVIAKGYKINDRVIRPAKVVVSRKPEAAQVGSQENNQVDENMEGGTYSSSE